MKNQESGVFIDVQTALVELQAGKMLIMMDDHDRENEGDLVMAADWISHEAINFMTREGRGLVCAPITQERARELRLDRMTAHNTALHETNFTVSIDAVGTTSTGISAHDRAATIRALIDPKTEPENLARPGHIFPLIASQGGVLHRRGHTEAIVYLAYLAGLTPAGVICEILADDGSMAGLADLVKMAENWGLKIITVQDVAEYCLQRKKGGMKNA